MTGDDEPLLRRGTSTFGGRQGRMGPTRRRAFDELVPTYAFDAGAILPEQRLVVEIGCGRGDATAEMAVADAAAGLTVVACEPNATMLAHLALLLDAGGISDVLLWNGDAFDVLAALGPSRVHELRIWFPDPWPRARQAGKRLVRNDRVAVLAEALVDGGRLRLATDHADYAAEALAAIAGERRLIGGLVGRPADRPVTKFEARGLAEGRLAVDIEARRVTR